MPWENRFDTKTASQTNAYRQLIGKEAMRRRNDAAILSRYRFHDNVTSLDGLAPHWDGTVVEGTRSSPECTTRPATAASGPGCVDEDGRPLQGRRALLSRQMRSSVLQEGYAYDRTTLSATGHAEHSSSASVADPLFVAVNPDSRQPRTRSHTREMNRKLAAERNAELRQRSEKAARETEAANMLKARLSSVAAKGSHDVGELALAAHALVHATDSADASDAVADVKPQSVPQQKNEAETRNAAKAENEVKHFGLRSCFLANPRPMSAANRQLLAERARDVFAPLPDPEHVTAARVRQASRERENESALGMRAAVMLPPRAQSATSIRRTPTWQDDESRPREVARTAVKEERTRRLEALERQLDDARSDRAAVSASLAALCDVVEQAQRAPPAANKVGQPPRPQSSVPAAHASKATLTRGPTHAYQRRHGGSSSRPNRSGSAAVRPGSSNVRL